MGTADRSGVGFSGGAGVRLYEELVVRELILGSLLSWFWDRIGVREMRDMKRSD